MQQLLSLSQLRDYALDRHVNYLRVLLLLPLQHLLSILALVDKLLRDLAALAHRVEDTQSVLLQHVDTLLLAHELVPRVVKNALRTHQRLAGVAEESKGLLWVNRTECVFLHHVLVLHCEFERDEVLGKFYRLEILLKGCPAERAEREALLLDL